MFLKVLQNQFYLFPKTSRISEAQEHKRERGFILVMSVTRLSSLCQRLTSTKFGGTVTMCLSARVVARISIQTTESTDTTTTFFFFVIRQIFNIEIPIRRNMLIVSPSNKILFIEP